MGVIIVPCRQNEQPAFGALTNGLNIRLQADAHAPDSKMGVSYTRFVDGKLVDTRVLYLLCPSQQGPFYERYTNRS